MPDSKRNAEPSPGAAGLQLRCPACGKRFAREATRVPPFCSQRCKLLDLGDWLDEKHRIPGDPAPEGTGDPDVE